MRYTVNKQFNVATQDRLMLNSPYWHEDTENGNHTQILKYNKIKFPIIKVPNQNFRFCQQNPLFLKKPNRLEL